MTQGPPLALSRPAAILLAPVLLRQGSRVRRLTPVLPEAAGAREGVEGTEHLERGAGPLRVLVLGESTAAGVGVAEQRDALGQQLALELASRLRRAVAWKVSARTGATARATARDLVPTAGADHDLVVVTLGVNDVLRLRARREWRDHVLAVVDAVGPTLAPGGRVLLAAVPDLGVFPALPQPLRAVLGWHARALDGELARIASGRTDVVHVAAPTPDGAAFAEDGFHPGAVAYARWARHLAACAPVHP